MTEEESKQKLEGLGKSVSTCMLDRYAITTGSVIIGVLLGFRQRNVRPFITAVTLGTFTDLAVGYFYVCRPQIDDYEKARQEYLNLYKKSKP